MIELKRAHVATAVDVVSFFFRRWHSEGHADRAGAALALIVVGVRHDRIFPRSCRRKAPSPTTLHLRRVCCHATTHYSLRLGIRRGYDRATVLCRRVESLEAFPLVPSTLYTLPSDVRVVLHMLRRYRRQHRCWSTAAGKLWLGLE